MDPKQTHPGVDWALLILIFVLGGALVCALLLLLTDIGVSGSIAIGLVVASIVALLFWRVFLTPLPAPGELTAPVVENPVKAEAPAPAPAPAPAAAPAATVSQPAQAPAAPVQPTTPLPGEAELADRKGSWSYNGEDSGEVAKPAGLEGARDGKADDLKKISGVGPKLEGVLNGLGIYHFDQIAAWSDMEIAWVDSHLEGFHGRATRDKWVDQAKTLAADTASS